MSLLAQHLDEQNCMKDFVGRCNSFSNHSLLSISRQVHLLYLFSRSHQLSD